MARNLKTGWVIVATSGATVDGRTIEKEWLEEMAEHYNPKLYSAKLKPDHWDFMPVGGSVLALKTQPAREAELKDEINLMAILSPNDWLIEANRQGQYTHCSIEVQDDFRGQGHFYLAGLGVTDHPASAGTSELHFKKQIQQSESKFFAGADINTCAALEHKPGLIDRLFKSDPINPEPEDDTMTPEQMEALQSTLTEHLDAKFSTLAAELKPAEAAEGEAGTAAGETETAAKFSALETENTALKGRLDELETKFTTMSNEPNGKGTPAGEGEGDGAANQVI